MPGPKRLQVWRTTHADEPRPGKRLKRGSVRSTLRLRPRSGRDRCEAIAHPSRRLKHPSPWPNAAKYPISVASGPHGPHGGGGEQSPGGADLHRLDGRPCQHGDVRNAGKHCSGARAGAFRMVVNRPHTPARAEQPPRGRPGNPHTVGTPGGECEALSARDIDEREDDTGLGRRRIRVIKQPSARAIDTVAGRCAVHRPDERREVASEVHEAGSGEGRRG